MSPRSRHPRNRQLPDNLRERDGYYSYRHPLTKQERGLGRDRLEAIKLARRANEALRELTEGPSIEDWVRGQPAKTWGAWVDRFKAILAKRRLADKTRVNYGQLMKRLEIAWPRDRAIESIDVAAVAEELKPLVDAGKERTAMHYRQFLVDCFDEAMAEGWRKENPAKATRSVEVKTKRARLDLDTLQRILAGKLTVWMRNAILLAVVTGQRREDITHALRRDIREGYWWCEQKKTGERIAIPLSLRLDAIAMSLHEVVEACKATHILSHYLIHQTRHMERSRRGDSLNVATISRGFADAVKALGIDWQGKQPPSFHELRSLSKRLYDAQGGVDTKQLLGHSTEANAALYSNQRGGWTKVSIK